MAALSGCSIAVSWRAILVVPEGQRAAVFSDEGPRELLGEVRGHGRNINAPEGECESAACPTAGVAGRIAAMAR